MTSVLQFNQQQAISGSQGGGDYVTESCVLAGRIIEGKWVNTPNGAGMFEISFEADSGKKANYLSICHRKCDGNASDVGVEQLQAMMGVLGVQGLNDHSGKCPEVAGKPIMLALERQNYTKQSGPNAGQPGYKFDIKAFMSAKSRQTFSEHAEGKQPESCEYWAQRFAQNPNGVEQRQSGGQQQQQYAHDPRQSAPQQGGSYSNPGYPDNFEDDSTIPF